MNKTINFGRSRGKAWVHPPESLIKGQVVYVVKFLGCVEVDQPKGSDMVRDAIRKMKFNRQIKKAEGEKPMKVELSISVDAIKLQEPKYKSVSHQFLLHHVSYCADDKADKRMFTFIAKEKDQNKHLCFVFDSEKSAEEITLTVGQAFDLAYRRFLEMSSKDADPKKQLILCQKKIQELTQENTNLRNKVAYLEKVVASKKKENANSLSTLEPVVGRRLENLILDSGSSLNGSGPATVSNGGHTLSSPSTNDNCVMPILAPPPPIPSRSFSNNLASPDPKTNVDVFGAKPFGVTSSVVSPAGESTRIQLGSDVFGMETFNPSTSFSFDLDHQMQAMDRELLDAQANFSRGLSFGTEDFSLEDLDPLKK